MSAQSAEKAAKVCLVQLLSLGVGGGWGLILQAQYQGQEA